MNWIEAVQLLSQFDMREIKALVVSVKEVADAITELKEAGNDRADAVKVIRALSDALSKTADVIDPSN